MESGNVKIEENEEEMNELSPNLKEVILQKVAEMQ